tara:strand:- start:2852 stop:3064 length:213 start_codon:yes stop_codon:yes gene_type:complete
MLTKLQLNSRLKELKKSDKTIKWTKQILANKIKVTPMTLYNKFENPDTFRISEIKKMVNIGFLKGVIIEL